MKKTITILYVLLLTSSHIFSQSFPQHHFKYNGGCSLENKLNTSDEKGNKVSVYECLIPSSESVVTAYRVNVITFKYVISDINEYYRSLKIEYSKLGETKNITLNGIKAVQVEEEIDIQGHLMKQISIATLYKNMSITLVLVSNDKSYRSLLETFKRNISFL